MIYQRPPVPPPPIDYWWELEFIAFIKSRNERIDRAETLYNKIKESLKPPLYTYEEVEMFGL